MQVFRFKRFSVVNERSAMKVNTDGVLLGAAMLLKSTDHRLLDIGTGTGTIALMAAQRLSDLKALFSASEILRFAQDDNVSGCLREDLGRTLSREADCIREQQLLSEASEEASEEASMDTLDDFKVDAIDIDAPSSSEAKANFEQSPWATHLTAHNLSLDDFVSKLATLKSDGQDIKYDLIFSNPPYFEDSLTAPDERKSTARHTSDGLSYRDIFDFSKQYLTENGRVALVLPADQEAAICRYARMSDMHLLRVLRIRTVPRKAPSRVVIEFSKQRVLEVEDSILTIQNEGQYTQEYLSLTKEFYLFA